MTTYTKSPAKIYTISWPGKKILRIYNSFSEVVEDEGESTIIEYPADTWGLYTDAVNTSVSTSYVRQPSCDQVNVSLFEIATLTGNLTVGSTIEFTERTYNATSKRRTCNGKLYLRIGFSALRDVYGNGTVWNLIADQLFKVSGFNLTFETTQTYQFAIESDFAGGYKNPSKPFSITVSPTFYPYSLKQFEIASAIFYMKESTDVQYTSEALVGNTVTVPAGTLQAGSDYDIYFEATDTNGDTAETEVAEITTTDGTAVVAPVYPINEIAHSTVAFSWNFSNVTGEPQYAFDLQTSTDGEIWDDVFSHEVTESTTATAIVSDSGTVYWRVRAYNQSNVAGSWTDAVSFVNIAPPTAPTILQIIPGGRISVQWSATEQVGYRLQILSEDSAIYDSGETYGTESLVRVNYYLPDGAYVIRVKIFNQYGLESEWAEMNYNQQTGMPALQGTAQYSGIDGGVRFTITSSGFDKFYLHRNGELIAKFTDSEYVDRFASGTAEYRLVAVNSSDNFSQAVYVVNIPAYGAKLVTESGETLSVVDRLDGYNVVSQSEGTRYSANEYLGASAPEHIFSKMRAKRITREFYDPDRISAQMLGKIAFYSDEYGNADWVAITSRSRADSWSGDETTIEMELTSRNEVIVYDD